MGVLRNPQNSIERNQDVTISTQVKENFFNLVSGDEVVATFHGMDSVHAESVRKQFLTALGDGNIKATATEDYRSFKSGEYPFALTHSEFDYDFCESVDFYKSLAEALAKGNRVVEALSGKPNSNRKGTSNE